MSHTLVRLAILQARITGTVALILGVLLWLGYGGPLIHAHMGLGALLVLALWSLALFAFKRSPARSLLALAWGLLVIGLGVLQGGLLPGEYHWMIQLAHLAVGASAMVQGEQLGAALAPQMSPAQA